MNSLELFSGAGGLAKGLELAGFNHAALIEKSIFSENSSDHTSTENSRG
jgi:DNA (cytosine-5)-methyltransferase 1